MALVVERAQAGKALTVSREEQLGHLSTMEKGSRKTQQWFMSLWRNFQLFHGGNELRVQRGQWWSQGPCWGRGVGMGERLSYNFCPHYQSHEGWQVWFLESDRAA